jgi:hypothetical protein
MCKIIFLKSLLLLKLFDNLSFSVGLSVIWMMLPRVILTLQLVDIFKDNQEDDLDCFASNLNVSDTSLLGLYIGANIAIEIVHRCWSCLWLECDFVTLAFKSQLGIP